MVFTITHRNARHDEPTLHTSQLCQAQGSPGQGEMSDAEAFPGTSKL